MKQLTPQTLSLLLDSLAAEQAADRLSVDEQADLLVAILELTMPRGLGPFVEKLSRRKFAALTRTRSGSFS